MIPIKLCLHVFTKLGTINQVVRLISCLNEEMKKKKKRDIIIVVHEAQETTFES